MLPMIDDDVVYPVTDLGGSDLKSIDVSFVLSTRKRIRARTKDLETMGQVPQWGLANGGCSVITSCLYCSVGNKVMTMLLIGMWFGNWGSTDAGVQLYFGRTLPSEIYDNPYSYENERVSPMAMVSPKRTPRC